MSGRRMEALVPLPGWRTMQQEGPGWWLRQTGGWDLRRTRSYSLSRPGRKSVRYQSAWLPGLPYGEAGATSRAWQAPRSCRLQLWLRCPPWTLSLLPRLAGPALCPWDRGSMGDATQRGREVWSHRQQMWGYRRRWSSTVGLGFSLEAAYRRPALRTSQRDTRSPCALWGRHPLPLRRRGSTQ